MTISFGNIGGNMETGDIAGQDMTKTQTITDHADMGRIMELAAKPERTDQEVDEMADGLSLIPDVAKDIFREMLVRTPELIMKYLIR